MLCCYSAVCRTFILVLWITLVVFLPALYLDVFLLHLTEGFDKRFCKAGIGHQRNVVVDGATADTVTVGQLTFRVVLRNVDDQVELVSGNHLHYVVFCVRAFIRPEYRSCRNAVRVQECSCSGCSVQVISVLAKHLASVEQVNFRLSSTRRKQYRLFRNPSSKSSPKQPTPPVDDISTPSTGSAFCRRAKENCEALTPIRSISNADLSGIV